MSKFYIISLWELVSVKGEKEEMGEEGMVNRGEEELPSPGVRLLVIQVREKKREGGRGGEREKLN